MTLRVNGVDPSANGGLGAVTATGADAAAARAAVGIASGRLSARAASPAVGDTHYGTDLDVLLRCRVAGTWRVVGEQSMAVTYGPFASNVMIQAPANTGVVTGGTGTSLALAGYVASLPGAGTLILAECHTDAPDTGWYLATSASTANRLVLYLRGINSSVAVDLGAGIDLATGAWSVALSISSTQVRATVKGGSMVVTSISGTYTPPGTGARLTLGANYTGALSATFFHAAYFEAWGSVLGDAALQAVATAYAAYLPGEAGADPTASWAACRTAPGAEAQSMLIAATPVPMVINAALTRTAR